MTSAVRLFHERAPGQARLGFLGPDDQPLEIWFDALHRPNLMGTVHRARISRVFPSQNRAMACLENGEVISLRLRKHDHRFVIVGTILPITIIAAPRHGKPWQAMVGARLATREMILLIDVPEDEETVQLSSKISGNQRKPLITRLMAEAGPVLPAGFAVILRREGLLLPDFGIAASSLIEMWQAGVTSLADGKLGLVFDAGDLLTRARRLVGNLPVIHDPDMAHDLSVMLDDVVAATMMAKSPLACGGHLWCEQTHAIWSIDLDGNGVSDLDRLCAEAVIEIARQIRLRGMSGPVLIDMPRLPLGRARWFREQLQNALDGDPRRPEYFGVTRGGLLELRVPHGEMALDEVMSDQPAQDALASLRLAMQRPGFHAVKLEVSKEIAVWLEGPGKAACGQLNKQLTIMVLPDDAETETMHVLNDV